MARLTSAFWVAAWRARLEAQAIPVVVVARGEDMAGAVIVSVATMDGRAQAWQRMGEGWHVFAEGAEEEVAAALARARDRDPDAWILEVEDPRGRHLLDEM